MIPMPKLDNDTILLAFVGVTALAIVMQTIILLAVFVAVRKAARAVKEEAEDLRSAMMPIIYNSRDLYARVAPRIESTVDDLAEIAHGLRVQTEAVESSAILIMDKLHRQTNRLDLMFTTVLDAVDRAGGFVAETVSRPVRQVSGLLSSIRAIIESLRSPSSEPRAVHEPSERDTFV
jgi:hypothetical protein